jgi:hypothetical protein
MVLGWVGLRGKFQEQKWVPEEMGFCDHNRPCKIGLRTFALDYVDALSRRRLWTRLTIERSLVTENS